MQTKVESNVQGVRPRAGAIRELFRFGAVGISINLILYCAYLLLVHFGVDFRVSMTAIYVVGTILGFILHRAWTFRSSACWRSAFRRYVASYFAGYLLNLFGLWFLVGAASLPHAYAQAIMILVVAASVFVIQKLWVFRNLA